RTAGSTTSERHGRDRPSGRVEGTARTAPQDRPPGRPRRAADRWRAADDRPVRMDDLDIAQDTGGGLPDAADADPDRAPVAQLSGHVDTAAVRLLLRQLVQTRDAEHDRPAGQLLDGCVRLLGPPVPVPGAAVRAPARDAAHSVPRPAGHDTPS